MEKDNVNHPAHYTAGGIECIEAIKASMTSEEFYGYLKGNALKYVWRYKNKGKPLEDLQKARWYLDRLINELPVYYQDELQQMKQLRQQMEQPNGIPEDCKDCQQEYRCDWDRSHCPLK